MSTPNERVTIWRCRGCRTVVSAVPITNGPCWNCDEPATAWERLGVEVVWSSDGGWYGATSHIETGLADALTHAQERIKRLEAERDELCRESDARQERIEHLEEICLHLNKLCDIYAYGPDSPLVRPTPEQAVKADEIARQQGWKDDTGFKWEKS